MQWGDPLVVGGMDDLLMSHTAFHVTNGKGGPKQVDHGLVSDERHNAPRRGLKR